MKCQVQQFISLLVLVLCASLLVACDSDCEPSDAECDADVAVSGTEVPATEVSSSGVPASASDGEAVPPVFDLDTFTHADINHVVVVTGQSNVEAPDTDFDPVLDYPVPRVFAFTDEGWQVADLHQVWDENAHPGNHSLTDPTKSPNNNFVFHYGRSLAQIDDDAVVGFIVLAAPGKGIANWDYESPFYWKMRNKINDALAWLPNKDNIDVLLWHQGESDAQYEGTSDLDATGFTDEDSFEYINYYAIKLASVIANFRSEAWGKSNLPFICGETRVSFRVNRRLIEVNEDNDPNTYCVQATDLPFRLSDPSGAHFSAAGLRELGRRYMEAYLDMVN